MIFSLLQAPASLQEHMQYLTLVEDAEEEEHQEELDRLFQAIDNDSSDSDSSDSGPENKKKKNEKKEKKESKKEVRSLVGPPWINLFHQRYLIEQSFLIFWCEGPQEGKKCKEVQER